MGMKIITIRQPWAHLIVSGSKSIENRTWATSYRGPVLIHASLNVNRALCLKHRLDSDTLPRGGVVGIAEIADRVNEHNSRWFLGPYGFVPRKRQPLPFIKWKGALGLREVPNTLLGRISPRLLRSYRKNSPRPRLPKINR
jgi:ASCH domain